MNRREVLIRVGGILLAIPASRLLMACGSDSGGSTDSLHFTSSTGDIDNHVHTVDLLKADISAPPAGGKTETTSFDASHNHTVTLTEADFQSIDAGNTVTKTTSEDETPGHVHTHQFAFHK
ncbi:MAG TPA: hypothetical protein VGG91_06320 [Myxococcaceae bacterium]